MDVDRLAVASQVCRVLSEEDILEAAAEVGRAGHAVEGRLGARVTAQVVVSSQSQGVALALCLGLELSRFCHTVFPSSFHLMVHFSKWFKISLERIEL